MGRVNAISILLIGTAALAGCSGSKAGELAGQATFALTGIPADALCLRVDIAGSRNVTRLFDLKPGQDAVFTLNGLPLGTVTFTESAFAIPCSQVTDMSIATWKSEPTGAVLEAGVVTNVTIVLRRNGTATITTDFQNDPDGGVSCFNATNAFVWPTRTVATGVTGIGTAPVNDTLFNPIAGASYNYFTQGATLFSYNNADGSPRWAALSPFGSPVRDAVTPVTINSGSEVIFVAGQDSRLWKLNAATPSIQSWIDTRRSASFTLPGTNVLVSDPVCPADQLLASPVVQLNQFANNTFRSGLDSAGRSGDDLVFVISNNQCSDHTHNTVKAYYASDLQVKWIFNQNTSNSTASPREMDGGFGCVLFYGTDADPAANTLYCTTALENPAGTQESLFAINTITGALRWSYNAGSILNRPVVKAGPSGLRVYTVNRAGEIMAFSPVMDPMRPFVGLPLWSTPAPVPVGVLASPVAFTAASGVTGLLLVDVAGNLRIYDDMGTSAMVGPSQNPTGVLATTPCLAGTLCYRGTPQVTVGLSPQQQVYVGRNDGRVEQLSTSLARQGTIDINPDASNTSEVFGISLDVSSSSGSSTDRLVGVANGATGGRVTRIQLPLCPISPPA